MSQEVATSIAVVIGAFVTGMVVTWSIRRVINRLLDTGEELLDERRQRIATLWSVARRMIWVLIFIIVVWTIAIIWQVPSTPFLAVGSAVGVALGFGAQGLVKDVIAGLLILSEDQFHVGDVVRIAGVSGAVEDLRLRVTVLRDLEGVVHYVPNGIIDVTSNLTQEYSRVVIDVAISYQSEVDESIAVLADELAQLRADALWGPRMTNDPEVLGVERLSDSSVDLRAVISAIPAYRWDLKREALRRIKLRFDAEGIEIPFPQLTIWQRPER